MSKLEDFLKKIHVTDDVLTKLKSEDEVDLDALSKTYIESRQDYFNSSVLPEKIKLEVDKTVAGMTLKAIKHVNKTFGFGFTNTQMEEYKSIDEFMSEAEKLHKKNIEDLTKGQKDDLVKQVNDLKEQVTVKQNELDKVISEKENEIKKAQDEKVREIRTFKAKEYFHSLVSSDKNLPDLPGKDFALENIREKIFSKYVVHEDGSIYNEDGTVPMHPDTSRPVAAKKIDDIYEYYKGIAGLVKLNNSGDGGKPTGLNPDGTPKAAGEAEKYFLEQLK